MLTKKNIYDHRIIFIAVITVLNIFLDQFTKLLAKSGLAEGVTVRVVGDLFRMRLVTNEGAFLGMGRNLPPNLRFAFFVIIPTILIILLAVYVFRSRHLAIYEMACFATIIGGGLSNLADRYIYKGLVTDFLNFGIGPRFRTGILNVADMSITFGAIVLLILYLAFNSKKENENDRKEA